MPNEARERGALWYHKDGALKQSRNLSTVDEGEGKLYKKVFPTS
jgi:hypothetical protein